MRNSNKTSKLGMLSLALVAVLCSCGSVHAEGKATVDATTTAGNGCLNAQISTMLGCVTDLSVTIDDKTYTLTKEMYAVNPEDKTAKTIDLLFTFTGSAAKENDKYVLSPATTVEYSIDWGAYYDILSPIGCIPVEPGKGTQDTDATKLNWFYSPYLKANEDNTKSMTVSFNDGSVAFEGFDLVVVEED